MPSSLSLCERIAKPGTIKVGRSSVNCWQWQNMKTGTGVVKNTLTSACIFMCALGQAC